MRHEESLDQDTLIDATFAVYAPAPIAAVGSLSPKGDGKWGHADLAGNLFEWTLDSFHADYLNPCTDCANLMPGPARALRGGSWAVVEPSLTASYRKTWEAAVRGADLGVRCARD